MAIHKGRLKQLTDKKDLEIQALNKDSELTPKQKKQHEKKLNENFQEVQRNDSILNKVEQLKVIIERIFLT